MATENKIAEALTMECEDEKRGIPCELLDPIPNKFSSEEPKKSPGMQDLPVEITQLLINVEDVQSSCDFAESTRADRKDIDRVSEGEKFLESSSEKAVVKTEDNQQLQRAGTLETGERTTDEGKHFQEEKSDQDYNTDDVTSAVSRVAKTVEANFNIIEEKRTEEVLDKNVDTGSGPKIDRTDNVVDPTFASQDVGENIFDAESKVLKKSLDLPAEQKAPRSLDIGKQTEDEKVEMDKIIQNGARDASIAAVAASSDTPNEDRELAMPSEERDKRPDESSTIVAADMSMKREHEVDTVELKETNSTESQDITELSAEMKHVIPAGANEEYKSNSTGSAVIIEPVAHSPHQIDEEVASHTDVEEANDLTQETVIQVVQNTLAEDEDGMDREENLDGSSAKHVESMQRDYSNPFSTEASEGERHDSGHLTGEGLMDVRGKGLTDAEDHIAKEISPVNAESEGSFLQQSLQGNEQPEINTEVLHQAVSRIKDEARSKSCEGSSTQKVDEDKSMDNWPKDEVTQENSPLNPEGDQQRSEAADLEIEGEKVTGEWEACNPKETKTEDGSEACKSTESQDAGHPSREGDIHCTESVAGEILQQTSEPEIVLATAPTCRAEHESCCGEEENTTEVDEYKELQAKSCNTTDLTDETIRTGLAEYSDTAQKENECEIKSSEEPEPAGADRSLEDYTPQGNEGSKMSLQISLPMHGEMTQEVEGKEKGTTVVNLADNSSITGLDMVIEEASMPEKDSEETVNKNEWADEFEKSLDEIHEPTEADSINSPKMGVTILCREELSAKGTDEDNVKYDKNEINKNYEQTGRSSTTEGPEDLILLNANKETGESTGPDLIEEDPIQERTTEAIAHREDNVMGCQVNPSTEEAVDYTKNITEETNAARDFEVLAEGISEGRPSKDDREEENNEEVHTQLVTFTSCKKTDDCEREEDAKSKLSPAVDEQEIENQNLKSASDAISLKEEGKDAKVFTEQVEAAHSIDDTANTEKDDMETCSKIQSTSIDECSEKEMLPTERVEYCQSESPCAPHETNSEVNGAGERLEVPSANGSQAAQVSAIEDGVPTNDESEARNHAGSTDTASGVDELPTSAKQERRLENTDNNVKEDDLTDSGQEKGEIPAAVDAIKESTECETLDKEPKDSKDLGTTEKPAMDTSQGSLCSILKTEAGEEECEASAEYEGPDKDEDDLYGTHSAEGVLMPEEDESTKIVAESEEVETAKGSAQKEVSEDLHVPPEVPSAVLNIAEGTYISATNATEETENQIQVDQHNTISVERSENTHLEMKEIEGETHDEDLKHQESFASETDIKSRIPEEKVSTENEEDNLKEYHVPDKAAFHSEVSTPIGEEMGAADTICTQNLKTMELTGQPETRNMEIEDHLTLGRETCIEGQVEEEVHCQDKEVPIGLVIPPMETIKEDTIKEPDSGINRDIAAVEIRWEEERPQKEQLDDGPNMASGICSDMGPSERTEADHSKHGEEADGTKFHEISINLLPNSSESDSKSAEREITIVENPTITEEEIELPLAKKDETRASDVKESTEMENCSSIEDTDAEETEKHEESERLATSATQNGEAAEDGSAPNQTIPRESTLNLLPQASVSLLEEKENGPKTADEKIRDDNEEEVEMQLNESLQLSSGTVQTDEACFDKKEPKKDGVSKIDSNDSESEKDTPNGQKDGCIHGEEVMKVETQEKESKTANPDSPEVGDTTAEVSVTMEEASSIVSSKCENVHEVVPHVQTNESFTRLEDVDLKDMKVEATIDDIEPEQKCEDAIEANDMSQNAITDEVVLQGQLKMEETQNGEELETGKGDKKLLLESCQIGEMKDFVPVLEDAPAIDQAEQAQAGNADNEEIQISKIETDDERFSTSKTEDATKDIVKEVVKETATLDDFTAPTTVAVETAEIGIPPKEASSGVFNKNVHEVMSDVQEYGSSIELEHDEMKGMKVEAVTVDIKPEEKCEDAIGANDMSQNGITNEGLPDENKRSEETQDGEQHENGEGDIKINEKKDYICPIPAKDIEEVDQDEQAQAGNAASMETAAEISIPREEASGDMFRKGEHMHEVMSNVQTNESSVGPEDAEMIAMKVEAVPADVEPAEKCGDGIEEIDMPQNTITNEGMTDAHMKAPLLESCTISEKKDFGKAQAEVTEATDQFELEKAGHADNEEIQTSESMIHDRQEDCVSVTKIEDATKDVEKESITEAGTTDESNATTLIAVPATTEIEIPTEEASGFVLSKSENTHEVVLDVQANESFMGSEDAEMKGTQVEGVMADVKPEEECEDASEANDMSQNAITSEGVLDSHTKEGGEENETREGDNASLLGSCKINEKKDFGPAVAEDTEARDQVEEAESENADNEEIQTSKSKTDDKPEDTVVACETADATKDVGKKIIPEVDTPDELNDTTIVAAETEIDMQPRVPPDSVTVQNSNSDDSDLVRELSHESNSAHDETIDGAEKTSKYEKLSLVENEAEPDGTAHQVTVSKTDQEKTVFGEETIADQALSAKKLESLVQTPMFASLPGGGEENIEKVENIEGHDKVAGETELKENLELSFPEERTDTACLERAEPRNPRVTELEISADESTQDTNEDEKEQNTDGEALRAAPEEKENETEFANSQLRSIKDKELSEPYEKTSDVMFETRKTAQVDMSEVQTMETSEELEGGEIQDVNLEPEFEAVAISKPEKQNVDAIIAENVEQEMQNEQEKADGSEEINEEESMKDVDSKETHGKMPGNGIINLDIHTRSVSEGEITHCDEQTNAEKLALEEDNILTGGGIYIAQTKDALEDFDVTKESKEEAGSCYDKTDTAALTSLRTETSMLAILQDDKPLEASPADLEGPSPEATEPGLILSSKNIDMEDLDETSSTSVCQLSDRDATTQNPHVSEPKTNEAGENDSSLFLVEKGGEAATTDENIGEKSLDGETAQINENIILTDVTEVCCKKEDSIEHADTEFEIQANQVTKDTSCEEDQEGSNQIENVKLGLPEEESERRSESSASADQGNVGTLAKAAADDLEPEKHCDIATEAADTLKDEILHEEVFVGPGEADEHENLMKEHQVEENCNPNETVATSTGNRAICEMTDTHTKAPMLESCTISEKKDVGKALAEVTEATDQFELEKAGHADNEEIQTSESMTHDRLKDCVSVTKIEDATKDVKKEKITEAGTTDETNATTLIAVPETTEMKIPTEETSGFVLSKSENTHEVVLDVQENESSMRSEDAETKGTQVEEVLANVKPGEKREDASEANDMSQNAITSEGVLDSQTKEGGEENETREGDNASLLGSCKINEKKDFGPAVAEDSDARDQVEEAESENADNEEIQTSKSKTDDKPEDSVLVCETADATKDVGKKIIQEVDTPDEFNDTTIAAAESEIAMREPQAEETSVETSTVPPDSVTFQNSNADDFERMGMVSKLSHDSNSAHDEAIDGAEKTSTNEKPGLVENEAEPEGTAHQVTVSEPDQGNTVFSEERIADQTVSAKKLESLVQTPALASLPGGEENIEKVENIEGHDKVAGGMERKENLDLSFPEKRTDTECLEKAEPRNRGVTELEISANESTQDTNEIEKEQNTHGEALKAAPEEKETETEFADSPLCSIIKDRELSGPYEKAPDVMFETGKTAQVDMSEVQTMETSEESEGGESQDVSLEAVAISKPAERNEDTIIVENVEQEMQNEQEKADGSEGINKQETMQDVDSKETHGTMTGDSIINQDIPTGSVSEGEITHCDEHTNAEKLASTSESYATVALEEDNILNGGGIYIAQTRDALEDLDVTKEIKEEAGSCNDKTDTAAMTSLGTETRTLAILKDDKPLEASPADIEGPLPEATEPGLILSSKNIDKENLETSSTSVFQLSDRDATTQNPHVSEPKTNEAGENDSSLFLVEKGGEAATTNENIGEKSLDGETTQINENIILTDVTEVCCKEEDSIEHADTEFEIQANQVPKDTSSEEDKEGSNLVENVKLELPEEESERRSESSASADQGNVGTLAKAAADDLEPEKHCHFSTEAADTLKDEILHEQVFIGPGEADEHESLMKEHQVEENCNPNETVAASPGNRAICEMTDAHMKAPLLESCTISEKKDFGKALAEVTETTNQFELEKAGHADNEEIQTSESMIHDRLKNCVSVTKIEDATKDVEKEKITEAGTTDESNATTLIAVPETTEMKIPTEEASGFVLSKSENTHEVVLDVQENESSMGSEDAETKGTQVEEVMADVKPEEKREDASEANDMSQNAITSEGVLDSHTEEGGEENETGEGDNTSLLGSRKIDEKKDFGPAVAEDTEARDQVEEAESENADNEEIQTSKSKTDDKPEDSILVGKTADATKDAGKKIIQEVDTPDEFNATAIAAAETEVPVWEPQAEETSVGTSTVPPDSVTFQNSNADDFERMGMVSKLSHDSNSAHDEAIEGAEKTSTNEKPGLVENEAEPEGTAHQVTVSEPDQGNTVFSEERIADQTVSAKKLELLVQTPVLASLPGGENMEKVENIEGHDKVAGGTERKENLELSFPEKRTDTECLEKAEPRNRGVTELETSANESTPDTNEVEKEQNTHGEALKAAPEEKEKETEFANSPLCSIIKDKELSGPYEKASDVMFETSKTAQVDMSEVQTVETSEESEGGEIQDVNLEAVAISKPAERNEDAIIVENVEQEMQNEQEKADGSEEINEQETMEDVDSKETHGTTPGNSIINQDMHTGSVSEGEITHCDEQTNAEKLASSSESYPTVALEEDNILTGGGIYIAQTKDALEDFDVTKESKEEAGSCYDKTDTAAMTSLRTETSMLAILQDDKPLEASPADLEGPLPEAKEPGLILSSNNIDKENLDETSSTSVCQLSDGDATTQNPHVSESRTNEAGENDSSVFLVEKGGEAATTDENIGEKSLDGGTEQVNENIILTDVTEVCCKKENSIKHADTEFEIQANQVTKDTSCEEDEEGSNQVENVKLELPEEESERRSESSASADQGNVGILAKAAADDLEPEKHCHFSTEAADTLKILHEEVFIGPGEADEQESLMKEHQVEENCNPNETVAASPGNRVICEEADPNAVYKEHLEASYSTEKTKGGNLDVEAMSNSTCDAQIQEVLHRGKTLEEENRGCIAPTEVANKDSKKLKDLDNWYDKVDTAPRTSLTSTPSSCMVPEEETPVDDSGTGFDEELPKEVEIETSLLKEKFETQLQDKHLATEDENVGRENVTAENLKADGLGRTTIASEAAVGSKDPGTDVIDAMEETTTEELDVSESRSHCLALLCEADATSDQNTSAKALEVQIQTPVSALLQEEHKNERKQDMQTVQEIETVLFSSAAEAKEEIWQNENGQFDPPKVHPRGSETIQDNIIQKNNECCSTQDAGLEPEAQSETKCTDFPSDGGKLVDLTSATESHEQGVFDDLVKSATQVKIQEDFNEPEDNGAEENQVHALARDLRAGEKGEETSRANETSQGENAEWQIVEQLEDIDSRPINQEITKGSCEEDELHHEKFVEGKTYDTFHSKANELQYQEDESKHSAVDKDNAPEEFEKVHVERETADKNSIDEAEGNITSEVATESEDQNSKTNSGSGTTDATICNKESRLENTRKGDDLGLEEAKETDPVLEQIEYASIAMPEMPVSGEACLSTAPDVIITEGNEDRSPTVKESIVETIQNSEAKNVELGDPSKADRELKGIEYGGETTCTSDEKASEEDMSKGTSLDSLSDLLDKIPEGNSPITEPRSEESRPTEELDTVPPEEVKIDEERDEHEEDEPERTEPGHDAPLMVEPYKDIDVKAPHKKSYNILSGVGSKVKHSISKVKKAITGKSSHSKAHPPK